MKTPGGFTIWGGVFFVQGKGLFKFIQVLNKGLDSRLKMPAETFRGNLQPAIPTFVQHLNNFELDIPRPKITGI